VRPGSSRRGSAPNAIHQQLQRENLDLAHKSLAKAKSDHEAIRKDYEARFAAFRESHQRDPTDAELCQAHYERYRTTEDDEYLISIENNWQEPLRAESTEEDEDEDEDEDGDWNQDLFAENFSSSSESYWPVPGGLGFYESSPPTSAVPRSDLTDKHRAAETVSFRVSHTVLKEEKEEEEDGGSGNE
jgi:hypothetical protein